MKGGIIGSAQGWRLRARVPPSPDFSGCGSLDEPHGLAEPGVLVCPMPGTGRQVNKPFPSDSVSRL